MQGHHTGASSLSDIRDILTPPVRSAMLSQMGTSYNVLSASLVLTMLDNDSSLPSSALIFGMICGQVIFGWLGDIIGNHRALSLTTIIQIVSALGSAMSPHAHLITWLSVTRFFLGCGCGGVYPLAASLSSESKHGSTATALTFSMQGIGYLLVPVVGIIVIALTSPTNDFAWRFLLAFGAFPPMILLFLDCQAAPPLPHSTGEESVPISLNPDSDLAESDHPASVWSSITAEPDVLHKLAGTAGTWFLFGRYLNCF
jgi:PHS family inorganic phosphate transporter-like MFS transporter